MQRRLAAIMFTDIEGYSTIMEQNEGKGIRTRLKHRKIFDSTTRKHNGKVLQYYGDGTLSIFDSAIDAVECAIEMQLGFLADPAIPVRIGIHTGDIIYSDEEVIGSGVNIASRIECLSVPGSVFISDKVQDEIKNQESIKTTRLSAFRLKNIEKPVEIYAVSNPGLTVPRLEDIVKKTARAPAFTPASGHQRRSVKFRKYSIAAVFALLFAVLLYILLKTGSTGTGELEKSIAVLPLNYLSEDQSKEYIADGVLDAITGHLSTIEGLRVMPRTSVEQYRGSAKTAREIGRELDVSYLIEGNFMIVDDQVSITIQLVTTQNNDHVYYNEYRRDYKDIIAVQSEVSRTIAREIEVAISPEVLDQIEKVPTKNMHAYDLYLRGRDAFNRYYLNRNAADLETCIQMFRDAIQSDSAFALPYAWLGRAIEYRIGQQMYIDYDEKTILSLCNKALDLEPELADGYWIRGRHYRNTGELEKAIDDFKRAIDINPNHALAYRYIGSTYFIRRDYIDALRNLKKAENLERGNELTQLYSDIGQVYVSIGDFHKAEEYFRESIRLQPNFIEGYRNLIWAEIRQGKHEVAYMYADRLLSIYPDNSASFSIMAEVLGNLGKYREAEEYYRKWLQKTKETGEREMFSRHRFALILWMNGKKEEARKLFDEHIEICESSIKSNGLYGISLAAYDLAGIYTFLDNKEKALRWLRQYEKEGFIWGYHAYIVIDPLFENLRDVPEFKAIVRRVVDEKASVREKLKELERQDELALYY
jgi:tetratricopeptide (TPR) repeat protein/class 3 adenylate cyclase